MPEGDTIHRAAGRLAAALVDREIVSIEAPQPRHRHERWPERLRGRRVAAVDARGKHLLLRFEGDLTLHSHLRMGGRWSVCRRGERWPRSPRRAWLVIRTREHEAIQFDGPVLELMTGARSRSDPRLAGLGPDVLAPGFDERALLRRLREDDQTRGLGDALLDQRNVAGIGNIWKSEACHLAGLDPWRALGSVGDEELARLVAAVRPRMRDAAAVAAGRQGPGDHGDRLVYGRAGRPCRRCGASVRSRGQGDDNRITYWCPGCQR